MKTFLELTKLSLRKYKDSNFARENLPTYLSKKQQKSNTQSFGDRTCKERVVCLLYTHTELKVLELSISTTILLPKMEENDKRGWLRSKKPLPYIMMLFYCITPSGNYQLFDMYNGK